MTQAHLLRDAREIFDEALGDCSIERAFARKLQVITEGGSTFLFCDDEKLDLTGAYHLCIVSVGKGSVAMLRGFMGVVPFAAELDMQGVLIAQDRPESIPVGFQFFAGGHPEPNQASFEGARAALDLISAASAPDDVLCLFFISGGASAMMELPLRSSISLEDTVAFYRLLVHSGATIAEINCIRKHFSAVKGGRLGLAAGSTPSLTFLISDVPPRYLDAVGSGPTMADSSTIEDCRGLLSRYSLEKALPESIRTYFACDALEETPKSEDMAARFCVLLDSSELGAAAERCARRLGYHVVQDNTCDDWGYAEAADYLLHRLRDLRSRYRRICLISTGEVTVPVPSSMTHARGGRNQHFALYVATALLPSDEPISVLSAGSDGIDGNSSAAGAVVSTQTLHGSDRRSQALMALAQFNSSPCLEGWGATVVTGPTGNNLRDLRILLAD